jgi:UDP-glucuronate decarboxylase
MSAGNQVRDYLFVDDAAEAILRLLELDARPPAVVNVVGPEQQTLREVAEQIVELAGSRSTLHFGAREPYPDDRTSFIGDGGRIQGVLGWHPARSLRAGMDETIAWYRKHRRQWKSL